LGDLCRSCAKCFPEICSLHAGQFSEITSPHFLFAGANDVIEQFGLFAAVHESESGTKRTSSDVRLESVIGGKADYMCSGRVFRLLTQI
jgi:hypothetical protein